MTEANYWKMLEEIGWAEHIPRTLLADVRDQLKINLKRRAGERTAYYALAQSTFEPGETSIADFIRALASMSEGVFAPTNIKATANSLSFKRGGKAYSCDLETPEELGALNLANRSLDAQRDPRRFIMLPANDSFICLVFVPPVVFAEAVKRRLIPKR